MRWRVLPWTWDAFLQIPGPTNVPDRVLRAIDAPTIDHAARVRRARPRGARRDGGGVRTDGPVVIYPSSGTGAWRRRW